MFNSKSVSKLQRPIYRFGCPNSGAQKRFSSFIFSVVFQQKNMSKQLAINDFTMHLIIWKWLRIQKCRQKGKTMRQRDRSKRKNCQRNCFHSFNYLIDHASIRLFFYVNSVHCFLWFLLYSSLHLLISRSLIAIQIF